MYKVQTDRGRRFFIAYICVASLKNPSTAISLNFIYYARLWLRSVRSATAERIRARVSEWRALYTFHADRLLTLTTATTRRYSCAVHMIHRANE